MLITLGFFLGLKKANKEELHEEYDTEMHTKYFGPIERFPEIIDRLINALNRVILF